VGSESTSLFRQVFELEELDSDPTYFPKSKESEKDFSFGEMVFRGETN